MNDIITNEIRLNTDAFKSLIGIVHLPTNFNVMSMIAANMTNEDEHQFVKYLVEILLSKEYAYMIQFMVD